MSKIEWTDETWNPVTGCTKESPGCTNCYAERTHKRLLGMSNQPKYTVPFNKVVCHESELNRDFGKKHKRIFVNSMSDLFHDDVPEEFIWKCIEVMYNNPIHTFQILTKRTERMYHVLSKSLWWCNDTPKNIHLLTSIENQKYADLRIPWILQTPAAIRGLSIEPMLGYIDLTLDEMRWCIKDTPNHYCDHVMDHIDWVICGGESGPGARPMHPAWVRSIRDQCTETGVPFFFKQWGEWAPQSELSKGYKEATQFADKTWMYRVGKKNAERKLDCKEWNQFPRL